jgi:hypothetical protein
MAAVPTAVLFTLLWAAQRKPEPDYKAKYEEAWAIATDLYNAHSGSAGQWERSRERYEKAVGK